ncbi:acyl carrier protein [Mycoplasma sp. Pen4]|uniref:phosphopantetheine-binding protein n=1 Tax=Mycoplasma sp. Pen4 TaxID=640330 RepID=UPI001654861D|nr:phosphopantetheine-binding protein [Mycoplasma sp. Pen4]QNM93411.1 acyl carrier protein [Mycoplasma sp. Pen4]
MNNNQETILNELKKISKKKNLSLDDKVRELGIDSLDMAELLFEAEEKFGVTISDEQLTSINTISDVLEIFK